MNAQEFNPRGLLYNGIFFPTSVIIPKIQEGNLTKKFAKTHKLNQDKILISGDLAVSLKTALKTPYVGWYLKSISKKREEVVQEVMGKTIIIHSDIFILLVLVGNKELYEELMFWKKHLLGYIKNQVK